MLLEASVYRFYVCFEMKVELLVALCVVVFFYIFAVGRSRFAEGSTIGIESAFFSTLHGMHLWLAWTEKKRLMGYDERADKPTVNYSRPHTLQRHR